MRSRISNFIFDTGEYFSAHLENGGIRVGMNGVMAIEVTAGHALYEEMVSLTENTIEAFLDSQIEAGNIPL